MINVKHFSYEGARAQLAVWDENNATLSNVISSRRGRGHANELMRLVCEYADKNQLTVLIRVQRYGYSDRDSPDNSGLKQWYRKFGFKDCDGDRMIRSRQIQGS